MRPIASSSVIAVSMRFGLPICMPISKADRFLRHSQRVATQAVVPGTSLRPRKLVCRFLRRCRFPRRLRPFASESENPPPPHRTPAKQEALANMCHFWHNEDWSTVPRSSRRSSMNPPSATRPYGSGSWGYPWRTAHWSAVAFRRSNSVGRSACRKTPAQDLRIALKRMKEVL